MIKNTLVFDIIVLFMIASALLLILDAIYAFYTM
jgi:hypothetical protein